MTDDDRALLDHYLAVGGEAWNRSLEALWLELELRQWVEARLPARRPLRACNVGIGAGAWDDWLADVIGGPIVSVDRDPACCRLLALRQRREGHPHPSEILCGDILDGVLGDRRFDLVTAVGSTLVENGPLAVRVEELLVEALTPGGLLLVAEAMPADRLPPGRPSKRFRGVGLVTRSHRR